MAATVRGSWTIDTGIVKRWRQQGLDATFRAEWDDPTNQMQTLHDGEARPSPPGPYCVFEVALPTIQTHQTGHSPTEEIQTQEAAIQFRVHAKSTGTESGKDICIRLAKAIKTAFDTPARLDVSPDTHVDTTNEPDFHTREGDLEWVWVVPYTLLIDAAFNI